MPKYLIMIILGYLKALIVAISRCLDYHYISFLNTALYCSTFGLSTAMTIIVMI